MATCTALNNLVSSSEPEGQAILVRAGALQQMLRLLLGTQHEGVLRRWVWALAWKCVLVAWG